MTHSVTCAASASFVHRQVVLLMEHSELEADVAMQRSYKAFSSTFLTRSRRWFLVDGRSRELTPQAGGPSGSAASASREAPRHKVSSGSSCIA